MDSGFPPGGAGSLSYYATQPLPGHLRGRSTTVGPLMRRALWVLDLAAVLLFVGIGRSVHTRGVTLAGMASTAWPFVTGLALGWLALGVRHRSPTTLVAGAIVAICTVAVGMTLRWVADQGIAVAFVFVALGFLGTTMLGWRMLLAGHRHLRTSNPIS